MYLQEKTNEAPEIKRVEIDFNLRFKPKKGKYEIYERKSRELVEFENLEIIPIADSRFTVKIAQNVKGIHIWSGLYKSPKQNITVMKKENDKVEIYKQGDWRSLKAEGLKYVKILHCLVKINNKWQRGEFEFPGITAIMWQDIKSKGTDRVISLQISADKDFETKMGNFYSMTGGATDDVPKEADETAKKFAGELAEMYKSHDENYEFYNAKNEPVSDDISEDTSDTTPEEKTQEDANSEEIPTIEIEDDKDSVKIEEIPF